MKSATLTKVITETVLRQLTEVLDVEVPKAVVGALRVINMETRKVPVVKAGERIVERRVNERPGEGKCGAIWDELDRLRAAGKEPDLDGVKRIGARKHWNENTTRIQFYRWRQAHSHTGKAVG